MKKVGLLKLNLGCGSNKIKGYVNIDTEKGCKPDLVYDFTKHSLPYKKETVSEILLFHTIEHIQKAYHRPIFTEFYRVLKPMGKIYISYPNFWECAQRWHDNFKGLKSFWENTLYGRQLYPSDFHVCAMDPVELAEELTICGFINIKSHPEKTEIYNTITVAQRGDHPAIPYEKIIKTDMDRITFTRTAGIK